MYDYRFVSIEHVSGACQLFRRACFEEIGGYVPIEIGRRRSRRGHHRADEGLADTDVHGADLRAPPEIGSAQHGKLKSRYRDGALDYALGGHPLWEIFRTTYQMTKRPYILGGLSLFAGYLSAAVRREGRPVSAELVAFRRAEQMRRLRSMFGGRRGVAPA